MKTLAPLAALRTLLTAATLLVATASMACAQATDRCADAPNLTASGVYPFDMTNATNDEYLRYVCPYAQGYVDVWYKFTASTTGLLSASVCDLGNDSTLSFHRGCGGAFTVPACTTTDYGSKCGRLGYSAEINNFPMNAGDVIWIRMAQDSSSFAQPGTLTLTFPGPVVPANDTCANAIELYDPNRSPTFALLSTIGANTEGPEASCAGGGASSHDIFFTYTAPEAAEQVVVYAGTAFDAVVTVFTGECGSLTQVACTTTGVATLRNVAAGSKHFIRIAGLNSSQGSGGIYVFERCASCVVIPPDAISEGEACGEETNGGCDSPSEHFFDLPAGPVTIAGTTWATMNSRDSDWYRFVTNGLTNVYIATESNQPVNVTLVHLPTGTCAGGVNQLPVGYPATLTAGTYAIVITPTGFADLPCGTSNTYTLGFFAESVAGGACSNPTACGCTITSEAECAASGGVYQGDGTICGYGAYEFSSTYDDISATGLSGPDGDNVSITANLLDMNRDGMDFNFYRFGGGAISINTNGYVQLDSPVVPLDLDANRPIPDAAAPVNAIFGLWTDLATAGAPNGSGHIYYQILGEYPTRRLVVQWVDVARVSRPGTVNFEIVLFEGTSNIELRYRDIPADRFGGTPNADYTVGVQNAWASSATSIDTSTLGTGNTTRLLVYAPCPPDSCRADFNGDGTLNADDLSDYFTGYFNDPPDNRADFNFDGVTNSDDISDYIVAYFNGC